MLRVTTFIHKQLTLFTLTGLMILDTVTCIPRRPY